MQTKGGDKAAHAAVPSHLGIANEGSLLTWSPQAVFRCLQSLLRRLEALSRNLGGLMVEDDAR